MSDRRAQGDDEQNDDRVEAERGRADVRCRSTYEHEWVLSLSAGCLTLLYRHVKEAVRTDKYREDEMARAR